MVWMKGLQLLCVWEANKFNILTLNNKYTLYSYYKIEYNYIGNYNTQL